MSGEIIFYLFFARSFAIYWGYKRIQFIVLGVEGALSAHAESYMYILLYECPYLELIYKTKQLTDQVYNSVFQ